MKTAITWAIATVVAIAIISHYSAAYYTEEAKQQSFMMKACVDAGGSWAYDWMKPELSRDGKYRLS